MTIQNQFFQKINGIKRTGYINNIMENIIYNVTTADGSVMRESKRDLERVLDDLVHDEITKIVKEYKYGGKTYRATLFTNEEEFGAEEYITHYKTMGKKYGHEFIFGFDIDIIRRFSI
jgi:hypothetical protein